MNITNITLIPNQFREYDLNSIVSNTCLSISNNLFNLMLIIILFYIIVLIYGIYLNKFNKKLDNNKKIYIMYKVYSHLSLFLATALVLIIELVK